MTFTSNRNHLFLYIFISVLFMDTIFKYSTINHFLMMDSLLSIIFLSSYILILYFIISFFQGNYKFVMTILMLGILAFIYSSQVIYYKFFKTFYSFYSLGNSLQALDFWKDVIQYIMKYSFWIIILFLPVIVFIAFGKKYFSFTKTKWLPMIIIASCAILIHLIGIGIIKLNDDTHHSAYDLYYKTSFPELSIQRLGLMTTMRLDIQRLLMNWSPELNENPFVNSENSTPKPSAGTEDPEMEQDKEEKEIEYNILDIDFDQLIAQEDNEDIIDMHEYFSSIEPTAKNEYTGKYEGYNLILVTAESYAPYAVQEDVTPTLYKMIHEGYNFTNFYTQIWEVSTSDGEYVALNSLIPKSGVWSFKESGTNSLPFVLGNQLKELGYQTNAYHNHTYTYYGRDVSHPNMGYNYKGLGNGLDVEETWPESDVEMMEKTVSEYIHDQPFHTYYMTVSGHMQYSFNGNYIAWKNKKYVDHLQYSDQAKAYLATQIELDRALEYLLDQLESAGIADKTLIALSGDHYPYGLDDDTINEFLGHPVEKNFELYKNNFILYTKGMDPETITKPASSLDILPTLSNLLGLEYDSRLMMGQDIFSDSPSLIPFLNKSFITDQGKYNSMTQEFIPSNNEVVDDKDIEWMLSKVQAKFYYSAKVLETDYYSEIFN